MSNIYCGVVLLRQSSEAPKQVVLDSIGLPGNLIQDRGNSEAS